MRPARDDGWQVASPESVGLDAAKLAALTAAVRTWPELGVHAILIERSGQLVYEEYFDGIDQRWGEPVGMVRMNAETIHDLRSVTKSVVSALVGIAMSEGAIRSLDQPVIEWFPEYPELNTPERRLITLEHVITMTSGLEWNEDVPYTDPANDEIVMNAQAEPLRYALSRPIVARPGAVFDYNGGMTHVMGAVLERATQDADRGLRPHAAVRAAGDHEGRVGGRSAGMPAAASGLRLRARDLARFGSMYLHGGKWGGRQILPAEWVARSTRRQTRFTAIPIRDRGNRDVPEGGEFGYGYFWWYSCHPTRAGLVEARTAVGNGQQRVFVLPGLDMVVTMFAGRYNDVTVGNTLATRILREHVVPAVRTGLTPGCPGS